MKQFGAGNWSKVSQLVPSRTSVQCRERWVNVLDEKIKRGSWDKEEETRLKQLCEKYEGGCGFPSIFRSILQC